MSRGRRYNKENKLNIKKVMAVLLTIAVIVMFAIVLVKFVKSNDNSSEKTVPLAYFTIFENNNWGVINGEGKVIIKPTYDEMIVIPNTSKDVFVLTYDVNYDDGTYKSKAINSKGNNLFTEYEKVEAISNYTKQNVVFYYDNCLKVEKDGKYGLIDLSGKQLIGCLYDDILPVPYLQNSLITVKDEKKGLISSTGAVIINNEYAEISALTENYEDGYIVKNNDGKLGVIGTNKKELVPVEYDEIENLYSSNLYAVKSDNQLRIYNSSTGEETKINATKVKSIDSGNIIIEKNGKYGLIDSAGEEVIEVKYENLDFLFTDYYIAKKDDKYGVINKEDETIVDFKYTKLSYRKDADILEGTIEDNINSIILDRNFEERIIGIIASINLEDGYIRVREGDAYKYYNFKFEEKKNTELLKNNTLFLDKKDGKYGFVNKDGIVVVNYTYDDATEQNKFGYAAVKKDGKWGAIDSKGTLILQPTLELKNNPVIDFISAWHLSEDLNSAYYTK